MNGETFEIRDGEIDVAGIMAKIRKNIDERKKKEIEVVEKKIKEHEERLIGERRENV